MAEIKAGLAPAGSAVKSRLDDGTVSITVKGVQPIGVDEKGNPTSDNVYVTLEYPDGFEKDHQVVEPLELLPKIVNYLRGRYGVDSVNVTTIPTFDIGSTIEAEVTNGPKS